MADIRTSLTEQINNAVAGNGGTTPVVVVRNKPKSRGGSENVLKWVVISGVVVLVVVVTVIMVLKSFEIKANPNLMLDEKVMENVTYDLLPPQTTLSNSDNKKEEEEVEIELVDDNYDENFITFDELRMMDP